MQGSAYVVGPFAVGSQHRTALPYGAEHLADLGFEVAYDDPTRSRVWASRIPRLAVRVVHRLVGAPVLEPVLEPGRLRDADLFVCFLEDNLVVLSPVLRVLRRGARRRRSAVVVVWLADRVSTMTGRQRRRWRRRLTAFGRVLVFSPNQVDLLTEGLDLPVGTVRSIPFGVEPIAPTPPGQAREVLTVGVDVGRDFPTFVEALAEADVTATIVTNAEHRASLGDTGRVAVVGPLSRADYLARLDAAGVVVTVTRPLAYPGGQTTLLEAMQRGRACVVTRSDALTDYATDEVDVLMVPPGDSEALRGAVERLVDDGALRARLGDAAACSASRFTEAAMWAAAVAALDAR